jgi:protein-tyrosine phosphatase
MCNTIEKDVNEIIPGLWLGNIKAAYDKKFLDKYKIKNILTIVDEFNNKYKYNDITYLVIPVKDKDTCSRNMINTFDTSTLFILNSLKNKENILVHCKKGHHRSAAIIIAFLVKYLKADYVSAIRYVNKLRPCALVRNTCMSNNLFKYYLHINNIKTCNTSCGHKNNVYYCECVKK